MKPDEREWELICETEPNDDDGSGNADRDGYEFMVRTYRRKKTRTNDESADQRVGCNHWPGQKRCEVCGMGIRDESAA